MSDEQFRILTGDSETKLREVDDATVQTCITSPPYWGLRDYGNEAQIGLEESCDEYVERLVAVFEQVRRVLRDDGTLWLNLGDTYAATTRGQKEPEKWSKQCTNVGSMFDPRRVSLPSTAKPKDMLGVPWAVAFALRAAGWYLRSDVIWEKPNAFPESVTDRPTSSYEHVFLLSKNARYKYNADAVAVDARKEHAARYQSDFGKGDKHAASKEQNPQAKVLEGSREYTGKRNLRDVWCIVTQPYSGAHFATFPQALVQTCIEATTDAGDLVLDPFTGSGTVALVATRLDRRFVGTELNPEYVEMATRRIEAETPAIEGLFRSTIDVRYEQAELCLTRKDSE